MTQNPDVSRGRSPAPGGGAHAARGRSKFRGKAWLLLCLPVGLTTWAAFLYIGIRARRRRWLAWAAVYLAGVVVWLVLDAPANPGSTARGIAAAVALATWIGGGVQALVVSNDAVRRIRGSEDPAVEAAETRIERRAAGRHMLASKPALAREVGIGRPDIPGADDYGLVDVNHCPATALTRLPGISSDLAERIVRERDQAGGFSSVEDLGVLLDLPPAAPRQAPCPQSGRPATATATTTPGPPQTPAQPRRPHSSQRAAGHPHRPDPVIASRQDCAMPAGRPFLVCAGGPLP